MVAVAPAALSAAVNNIDVTNSASGTVTVLTHRARTKGSMMNKRVKAMRRMAIVMTAIAAVATALAWTLTATPGAAARASAALTASAAVPRCSAADLGVWVAADQTQGAAGTLYMPIEFTNLSHHACTLDGFPGVSALSASGHQLGSSATWDHAVKPRPVRLAPGGTGYAVLEYSNVITGNCPPASKRLAAQLRVYPPDQFGADHAYWPLTACVAKGQTHFLRVRAIAPGIGVIGSRG